MNVPDAWLAHFRPVARLVATTPGHDLDKQNGLYRYLTPSNKLRADQNASEASFRKPRGSFIASLDSRRIPQVRNLSVGGEPDGEEEDSVVKRATVVGDAFNWVSVTCEPSADIITPWGD